MAWGEILKVLVGGVPTLLVAVIGLWSVLLTQARADERQGKLAASAREFQRDTDLLDKRRAAGAEFISAVRALNRYSREVLPDESDASDLTSAELTGVELAYSRVLMLCDRAGRAAATALIEAMYEWIKTFSEEDWKALDAIEDRFIAAVNGESGGEPAQTPSR